MLIAAVGGHGGHGGGHPGGHWGHWGHYRHYVHFHDRVYVRPVSYAVRTSTPGPCTCLTKNYTPEGRVVFQDLCTKEMASAPADGSSDQTQNEQAPASMAGQTYQDYLKANPQAAPGAEELISRTDTKKPPGEGGFFISGIRPAPRSPSSRRLIRRDTFVEAGGGGQHCVLGMIGADEGRDLVELGHPAVGLGIHGRHLPRGQEPSRPAGFRRARP